MCLRQQYITDTSIRSTHGTLPPDGSLGKLTHTLVCSIVVLNGRPLGRLFANSHTVTEESFFHPGPQYGMQQLSRPWAMSRDCSQRTACLQADVDGWLYIKFRPGNMARCLFIHMHNYNAGGADDMHVHNKYMFELLSANSAAIGQKSIKLIRQQDIYRLP